jgi:CRISPR-associated endonuclease/helicase Cas3
MTAAHRRHVLEQVRARLKKGEPVRLVSTSLIEAGVDIDFPQVWRQLAGVDSIAQAAGRCNREGRRDSADVFVFRSAEDYRAPADVKQFARVAGEILEEHADPLSLEAVRAYFRQIYWDRGAEALDAARVGGITGIMKSLAEAGNRLDFPFADIAAAFRMIEGGAPLIITGGGWGLPPEEEQRLRHIPHAGSIARALQTYQVQIPPRWRQELLAQSAAEIWRGEEFGEQFVFLVNSDLYDRAAGLRQDELEDLGTNLEF